MRNIFLILSLIIIFNCNADAQKIIVNNKKSYVNIVCEKGSIASEQYAAKELSKYLKQISGANFIVSEKATPNKVNIYVGQTSTVKKLISNFNWDTLKTDGILIKSIGNNVILAGDRPRGTIYAVYEFLDVVYGVKFYAADCEVVPKKAKLLLPKKLDIVYKTPFIKRDLYSEDLVNEVYFKPKIKINGDNWAKALPEELGGSEKMGTGHSFTIDIVSADKYFASNPNLFALRNGVRVKDQLCLTNPDTLKVAINDVIDKIESKKEEYISLGENDNDKQCMCDNCVALRNKEGGQAGVVIAFANKIINEVGNKYPNVKFSTLAYWHTDLPPKDEIPSKDLLIIWGRLDRHHAKGPSEDYSNTLRKWCEISGKVYVWDYYANFGNFLIPHPNYFTCGEYYKLYKDIGVKGLFVQNPFGSLTDFLQMRTWVQAKLAWNPDQDVNELTKEFCNAYYKDAGPILYEYIVFMTDIFKKNPNKWLGCYDKDTNGWLTYEDTVKATKMLENAIDKVKDDPVLLNRVIIAKSPIDLVWIQRYNEFREKSNFLGDKWIGPNSLKEAIDNWEKLVVEKKCFTYKEWDDTRNYISELRKNSFVN